MTIINLRKPLFQAFFSTIVPERAFSFYIKISRNIDPACGSGSFLLGAFWTPAGLAPELVPAERRGGKVGKGQKPAADALPGGGWKLTTAMRKQILLNNIHGVDIDILAVEMTSLPCC